jgi:hypothetical protein
MKKSTLALLITAVTASAPSLKAALAIGHVQASTAQFLNSAGGLLGAAGGISVGFFTTNPADTAFGNTIIGWSDLLTAGYKDVRSLPGVTLSTPFDWDFPNPTSGTSGGTVSNINISNLPQNTQLYVIAFNAGSYNSGTPGLSFAGSTEWAVIKDNNNLSPADGASKSTVLSTAVGSTEVLIGTDNGNNVNLAAIPAPIPEPSTTAIGVLLAATGLGARRRQRR